MKEKLNSCKITSLCTILRESWIIWIKKIKMPRMNRSLLNFRTLIGKIESVFLDCSSRKWIQVKVLQTGERKQKHRIVLVLLTWQLLNLTSRSESKKMKKKIMIKKLILMLTCLIRQNYQMMVVTIEISIMMKMKVPTVDNE